jgi:hypothetical protein
MAVTCRWTLPSRVRVTWPLPAPGSRRSFLLAIIGPGRSEAKNPKGVRRLDDTKDFVRIELGSALKRDIRVIPVLIDGAPMPQEEELPEPLKPIARRNAVQVSHVNFGADTQRLVEVLKRLVTQPARVKLAGLLGVRPVTQPARLNLRGLFGVAVASAFALVSLPIRLALVRLSQWTFGGSNGQVPLGLLTRALLAVVLAFVLARWRGAALNGVEIALYWTGSAIPVGLTVGNLHEHMKWSWFGSNDHDHIFVSAWLTVAFLTVVSALAMARRRRAASSLVPCSAAAGADGAQASSLSLPSDKDRAPRQSPPM